MKEGSPSLLSNLFCCFNHVVDSTGNLGAGCLTSVTNDTQESPVKKLFPRIIVCYLSHCRLALQFTVCLRSHLECRESGGGYKGEHLQPKIPNISPKIQNNLSFHNKPPEIVNKPQIFSSWIRIAFYLWEHFRWNLQTQVLDSFIEEKIMLLTYTVIKMRIIHHPHAFLKNGGSL